MGLAAAESAEFHIPSPVAPALLGPSRFQKTFRVARHAAGPEPRSVRAALINAARAKVVVVLGPTSGYEIWEKFQTIRGELPAGVRVLTVQMPGDRQLPDIDVELLASRQPGDKLAFSRKSGPDDVAAYIHSGGTTGSPKLVQLTHRGFSYKFWVNTLVMAHTASDIIFSDYPMFHIAGFFGRGIMAIADGMTIVIPSPIGARDKVFIANYWKFVETYRISILFGVPTTLA